MGELINRENIFFCAEFILLMVVCNAGDMEMFVSCCGLNPVLGAHTRRAMHRFEPYKPICLGGLKQAKKKISVLS